MPPARRATARAISSAHLAWTDDIADPSEITSYFAYFPNIHSLHSGYQDKTIDDLFETSQKEIDPKAKRAEQYKRDPGHLQ